MSAERLSFPLSPDVVRLLKDCEPFGFDLDGVMVDLAPLALQKFNKAVGTQYTLEDLDDPWRMTDWYMQLSGRSKDEALEFTKAFWNSPDSLENALPIPGSMEVLDTLDLYGLGYYFITSRPFYTHRSTENWFKRTGNARRFMRVLMQSSDTYNNNHKVDTINNFGIKVHFEDMPLHATDISKNTDALVVLVNQTTNRTFVPNNNRIIRPNGVHTECNLTFSFLRLIEHLQAEHFK